MQTLSMTLSDTLSPVSKKNFKKWHSEGALAFVGAGNGVLDVTLSRLNNTSIDWRSLGKQVSLPTIDGKHNTACIFSNGIDEFILVIDDMQGSDYLKDYLKREGKQHITVYVVKD